MNYDELYLLNEAFLRGALRICPRDENDIEDDFALLRAEICPKKPIAFVYQMGNKPRDLIGTGYATLDLVSDRFINLLRDNHFTGWTTYPVEVYGKHGERINGYHGFAVTGRCGPIDNSKSMREWRPPVDSGCPPYQAWMGLYFDPDSWDGSDIFVPKKTGFTIVVKSVKEAIERAKLKNIAFEKLTEVERLML